MEERLRFIARLLDGEKMAGLCREFGISRKTGYKIYDRYQDCGLDGRMRSEATLRATGPCQRLGATRAGRRRPAGALHAGGDAAR